MRKLLLCVSVMVMLLLTIVPLQAQDMANVRMAHFSPDTDAVDVYVDGAVVVEALEYPVVTSFLELEAGTYEVAIAASGTSLEDAVLTLDVTVEDDTFTTVAVVGSSADETLRTTVFTEDLGDIASDEASLTVVHAMDAPAIDVYGSGILLVQTLRFPSASADGAFTRTVPVGTYDFDVTISENRAAVLAEADDIPLEGGTAYMVVALGSEDAGEILIVTPDEVILSPVEEEETGETTAAPTEAAEPTATPEPTEVETSEETMPVTEGAANVRVAHFSSDTDAVDVYVNGSVLVEGLEYPAVASFTGLEAGTYQVAVAASGTSVDDAVLTVDVTIEDDTFTTVAVVGSSADETLRTTVFTEDIGDIGSDEASLTVVHAMDAPAIDVYGSGILLVQTLRFPSASADGAFTRTVPVGTYDFDVTISENRAAVLAEADDIPLEGGTAYMVVALGSEDAGEILIVTPDEVILSPVEEEE